MPASGKSSTSVKSELSTAAAGTAVTSSALPITAPITTPDSTSDAAPAGPQLALPTSQPYIPQVVKKPTIAQVANKSWDRIERKVVRKARQEYERAILAAGHITDDGLDVPLTERDRHMAMDMRKPKRYAPVYLEHRKARIEATEKLLAAQNQNQPTTLNIGQVVNVVQMPEYPVLELGKKE